MTFGQESTDEMAAIVLSYEVAGGEAATSLREALADRDAAALRRGLVGMVLRARAGGGAGQQIALIDGAGRRVGRIGEPGAYGQAAAVARRRPGRRHPSGSCRRTHGRLGVRHGDRCGRPAAGGRPTAGLSPVWSPDGRWIAYVAAREDDVFDVYRRTSDGLGRPELVYTHTSGGRPVLTDSAHGVLTFWAGRTTYVVPVADGAPSHAAALIDEPVNVRGGRVSPEGRPSARSNSGSIARVSSRSV